MKEPIDFVNGYNGTIELYDDCIIIRRRELAEEDGLNIPVTKKILLREIVVCNYHPAAGTFRNGFIEFVSNNPEESKRKMELESLLTAWSDQGSHIGYNGVPIENQMIYEGRSISAFNRFVDRLMQMNVNVKISLKQPDLKPWGITPSPLGIDFIR